MQLSAISYQFVGAGVDCVACFCRFGREMFNRQLKDSQIRQLIAQGFFSGELDGFHSCFDGAGHIFNAVIDEQDFIRGAAENNPQDSGPRLAALARDRKDHHGTSWLLQATAYASLAAPVGDISRTEDSPLAELRHRFKTVTLRAQIAPDGTFPHELGSQTPYRDSLFNLDMLAGICQLLSTRFDNLWDYSLEDGPGMRSAIAYHFPFIADRTMWPFRADATHFDELPGRRASLLLTARAYQRPEYAALWKTLRPDPPSPDILRTLPIHQPLLWVRQPPRPA